MSHLECIYPKSFQVTWSGTIGPWNRSVVFWISETVLITHFSSVSINLESALYVLIYFHLYYISQTVCYSQKILQKFFVKSHVLIWSLKMHFAYMSLKSACHLVHNICQALNDAQSSVLVLLGTERGETEQLKCIS